MSEIFDVVNKEGDSYDYDSFVFENYGTLFDKMQKNMVGVIVREDLYQKEAVRTELIKDIELPEFYEAFSTIVSVLLQ